MPEGKKIDRRNFFKVSCLGAVGVGCLSGAELRGEGSDAKSNATKHCKWWLDTMMSNVDECETGGECIVLVEKVGRECARLHAGKKLTSLKVKLKGSKDIDFIEKTIDAELYGSRLLRREGDDIVAEWDKCLCPTRSAGLVSSPVFCDCTKGYFKEVF